MIFASWQALASKFFNRSRVAGEMEEEVSSHIALRADDLERSGLSRADAERQARIEFGGQEKFKEECHEALGGNLLDTFLQDTRLTLRILRKSPSFTSLAVLTLALAIGANAVVFGVMNGLILRPLNVPQADNLWGTVYGEDLGYQSYPNYLDLRSRNRSFEDLAAFNFDFVGFDAGTEPSAGNGFAVTGNYFDVLRIKPYLGRFFHSSDERGFGSAPFLVLSYAFWHTHFQDDRGVIGRTVRLNKHPFTIIGVAPPEFHGTLLFISPDFFLPMIDQDLVDGQDGLNQRASTGSVFEAMGHLKPGVTPEQAASDLKDISAYLEKTYPKDIAHGKSVIERTGLTSFGGPVREFVAGLMILAALILLAACANLGSLFAARAADRSRELALRLALGSSRRRILRQLLTEAIFISLLGGALGLVGSVVLLRRLVLWHPFPNVPIQLPISPDARIYAVALGLAIVSGFLFGIVPVRQVLRTNPYEVVKTGPGLRVGRRLTVRDALLVSQIAICAVLVTSSIVAIRGLMRSLHSKLGFEPENTMLVSTNLAMAGYRGEQIPAMQKSMIEALETLPGVQRLGLVNDYPPLVYTAATRTNIFKEDAADLKPASALQRPYEYGVSPGYFDAAGTTVLAGRDFNWHDDKDSPPVAVVNREFARKIFGSVQNSIGRYFKLQSGKRVQVVGVVEDGKYLSLTEDPEATMFIPSSQGPTSLSHIVLRSTRDRQELAAAVRNRLREMDSGLPVETSTWASKLDIVLFPARVATMALGVLGIMGAVLSITGIFAMAAYSVSKRLRELGIRVALGAQQKEVLGAALGRAVKLVAVGSGSGLVLGVLASKLLAYIVYQATPRDPVVLLGSLVAMAGLAFLATWIPARRALSIDPAILLREE